MKNRVIWKRTSTFANFRRREERNRQKLQPSMSRLNDPKQPTQRCQPYREMPARPSHRNYRLEPTQVYERKSSHLRHDGPIGQHIKQYDRNRNIPSSNSDNQTIGFDNF